MLLYTLIVITVLLFGLASLFLSVYFWGKNPKARVNRDFFYFGFAIFLWCAANFAYLLAQNLFWLRATYAVGSIVPLVGIFFTYALVDKKMNKWLKIFIITIGSAFFAIYLFSPLLVENQISFSDSNPIFSLWGIYILCLSLAALAIPVPILKIIGGQKKKQFLFYIIGTLIFTIWAIYVGVIIPLFKSAQINSLNWATASLFSSMSYSAIKDYFVNIWASFFKFFDYCIVTWPLYIAVVLITGVLIYIVRLLFVEKNNLEKAKTNLTKMLERSEESRTKTEAERDRTKTIVNSFSDGLIILNEDDEIFSINPEAERVLGLEINKLLGKPFQSLAGFPKTAGIVSILNTKVQVVYRKEVELAKGFIVELSVLPLGSLGNSIGHLIVIHDVSREKIVEKMKTEFVSLAAHQLRTPLSIIKWTMSMLRKGDFGKLTGKQNQLIERTFQNNERLITLVNDLLNVTRIEEGKYLYKIALADIREIVKFVLDSHKERIKNKKIKIEFQEPESIPQLMLDSEKIKLVVQNLVDNAIEYSLAGGKIIVTLGSDARNVEVRVQDFGMGIPKNQQDKIFTKFFRGDNAAKVNTAGTGLGLFLSKNIVEAHGGIMWFKSEENVGTTFFFTLPIKRA